MKLILYFLLFVFTLVSCGHRGIKAESNASSSDESTVIKRHKDAKIISFFGHELYMEDAVIPQLIGIASKCEEISVEGNVMAIGEVKWGINVQSDGICLLTSIQPESPKMESVKRVLTRYYGEPYEECENDYKWSSDSYSDSEYGFLPCGTLVHLRRINTEEGGTALLFY